ncbi:SDR family oxidoreductase [Cupriavidus plantarum]|uniref:SDR family oxidoreductase n=1 Tax=Cupriavidus plantarum TaxID=942865 RepID=UPI000E223D1B|nr:SDR family oxidoreductase [Cupriavidus plantarum]REE91119.1 NAD(P)-dependent dehydrogenase (short-subunit alcohol dehydrogenase family) [Cupriavidus plantarum]RLK33792.1 NAD(P)-dependent dehydrogenase (short-subunit alcohol dehydrogenase family) [Cupriavidus plantarum]CAG2147629.1 Aklaviketone reductase DauE [Cupriavidus plantarum]SMR85510.1 NAD(P)-dependent dehydrogenase, short-chain alcohol dehydrogenase family [Cupriavidus plantarum]
MHFTDQTVSVIVGGQTGIGRAVADALSERPGRVLVASRRNGLDIADPAAVERYFEQLGPVDHVVFTAGSQAPGGKLADVNLADAKAAFDVKFWGTLAVARAAAKHLRPGGTLTLTSGFLARRTVPGTIVKTAMNAALEAVAKILARELAPIRVNVVSPGLTDTEAYAGMDAAARSAMLDRAATSLPVGRYGRAEDLAQGYLLAIDNPFMTGAIIDIDGGALIN